MAIRKKISGDWTVVSIHDDAIDWSQTSRLDYIESRDQELLVYREGEQATVWTARPLPPGILSVIEAQSPGTREFSAFSFGIVDCSDAADLGLKWDRHRAYPSMTDDSLGRIPVKVVREIGELILRREDLSEGESLRSARLRG